MLLGPWIGFLATLPRAKACKDAGVTLTAGQQDRMKLLAKAEEMYSAGALDLSQLGYICDLSEIVPPDAPLATTPLPSEGEFAANNAAIARAIHRFAKSNSRQGVTRSR